MDDPALQSRLGRIERLLSLVVVLVVIPYFVGLGELVGYWIAAALGVAVALFALTTVFYRRRTRTAAGQ